MDNNSSGSMQLILKKIEINKKFTPNQNNTKQILFELLPNSEYMLPFIPLAKYGQCKRNLNRLKTYAT